MLFHIQTPHVPRDKISPKRGAWWGPAQRPQSPSPLPLAWQPSDLHPVMAAALISNKPEFVKLFLEQGVRLKDFVTWDTLVYLYDNLAPSCLFHSKLQKVLLEEREHTAGSKMPRLQMHHVSQVLRELLGCSTQPLYPKPKHTERPRLSIPVPHIKLNVSTARVPGGRVAAGRGHCCRELSWRMQLGLCRLVCSKIVLKVP